MGTNKVFSLRTGWKSSLESLWVTSLFLVDSNADHPEISRATSDTLIGTQTRQLAPNHLKARVVTASRFGIGLPCSSKILGFIFT